MEVVSFFYGLREGKQDGDRLFTLLFENLQAVTAVEPAHRLPRPLRVREFMLHLARGL